MSYHAKIFEVNSGWFTYYSKCATAIRKVNLETPASTESSKTQGNFQLLSQCPTPLGMGRGTVVPAGKPPTNGIPAADLVVIIVPRISLPTLNLGLKKWG